MKVYYSYQFISDLAINLCDKIKNDFEPDYILAISGGGLIPSRMVRKYIKKPIISVTVQYYDENDNLNNEAKIIQWVDKRLIENKKILIIDEIDDTGSTLSFVIDKLKEYNPKELSVGVIFNKDKPKKYNNSMNNVNYYSAMDIYDNWVVFPWE